MSVMDEPNGPAEVQVEELTPGQVGKVRAGEDRSAEGSFRAVSGAAQGFQQGGSFLLARIHPREAQQPAQPAALTWQ